MEVADVPVVTAGIHQGDASLTLCFYDGVPRKASNRIKRRGAFIIRRQNNLIRRRNLHRSSSFADNVDQSCKGNNAIIGLIKLETMTYTDGMDQRDVTVMIVQSVQPTAVNVWWRTFCISDNRESTTLIK